MLCRGMGCLTSLALGMVFTAGCGASGAPERYPGPSEVDLALTIVEPATDIVVSRGGQVAIACTDLEPDGLSLVSLVADRDGDLRTVQDAYSIAQWVAGIGDAHGDVTWDTTGVAPGEYHILGRRWAWDGASGVARAPGHVHIRDLAWAQRAGGDEIGLDEWGKAVATFADGSSIVVGTFQGSATFGEEGAEASLTSWGGNDVFLARYEENGRLAWVRGAGGVGKDVGLGVCAFPSGACAVTGQFGSTARFGDADHPTYLRSMGSNDAFLALYDAAGDLAWVRQLGGTGLTIGEAVAALSDGSCIVAGSFTVDLTLGEDEGAVTLSALGSTDGFVARFGASGELTWVRRIGSSPLASCACVSTFLDDSFRVAGSFQGSATFEGGGNEVTLSSAGSYDAFVAGYDAGGSLSWAERAGGMGYEGCTGIAVLPDGSCVVVGPFTSVAAQPHAFFGEGERTVALVSAGDNDVFVACYEADGALAWARRAGGVGDDMAWGVSALPDGSCLIAGQFGSPNSSNAIFGPRDAPTILVPAGYSDVFLARYGPLGSFAWARRAGGPIADVGYAVACFGDGSFVATGRIGEDAGFGTGSHPVMLTPVGTLDIFVARYNADGDF